MRPRPARVIVGSALPGAALEILATIDNFEEGPSSLTQNGIGSVSGSQFTPSPENLLSVFRLVEGTLHSGTSTSANLVSSPDDDGVAMDFDAGSGGG